MQFQIKPTTRPVSSDVQKAIRQAIGEHGALAVARGLKVSRQLLGLAAAGAEVRSERADHIEAEAEKLAGRQSAS